MKTNKFIICFAMAGLLAQPLSGLGQNAAVSGSRTNGSAVVVLPAGGDTNTNAVSVPRDPAVNVAVAYETLQVIRARAAANTNAPRISVDQIRERTESVLDEVIKKLQTMQTNAPPTPSGGGTAVAGADQPELAAVRPVLVAGPAASRTLEERLAALEARVNGHGQRLQEIEHKVNVNR